MSARGRKLKTSSVRDQRLDLRVSLDELELVDHVTRNSDTFRPGNKRSRTDAIIKALAHWHRTVMTDFNDDLNTRIDF